MNLQCSYYYDYRKGFVVSCLIWMFVITPTTSSSSSGSSSNNYASNKNEMSYIETKLQLALQDLNSGWLVSQHGHPLDRQFLIPWKFDNTPEFVCETSFSNFGGTDESTGLPKYTCSCTNKTSESALLDVDGNIVVDCVENSESCNDDDGTFCYKQVFRQLLNDKNNVTKVESCANFVSSNFTRFAAANVTNPVDPTGHNFCVTLAPVALNDFSKIQSCSATMDEQSCFRCEICEETRLSMDCCNIGGDYRMECLPIGGGGAFLPFFDTPTPGEEGICDAKSSAFSSSLLFVGGTTTMAMMMMMSMASSI